jgi:hypothetical protein
MQSYQWPLALSVLSKRLPAPSHPSRQPHNNFGHLLLSHSSVIGILLSFDVLGDFRLPATSHLYRCYTALQVICQAAPVDRSYEEGVSCQAHLRRCRGSHPVSVHVAPFLSEWQEKLYIRDALPFLEGAEISCTRLYNILFSTSERPVTSQLPPNPDCIAIRRRLLHSVQKTPDTSFIHESILPKGFIALISQVVDPLKANIVWSL